MATSILDHRGGILKTIHTVDHDEDTFWEAMEQDVDPMIEHVKMLRETHKDVEGMKLAAFIPDAIVERMMRDGSIHDEAALKRWLNDPQNDCFRVWRGRV